MILYHYTNQKGLLGILKNKSIWATNIFYLNDKREFSYAIVPLKTAVRRRRGVSLTSLAGKGPPWEEFIEMYINDILDRLTISVFVFSLSEKSDLLSQWRAYAERGKGFSIGFDQTELERIIKKRDIVLQKCVYEPEDQIKRCEGIIEELIERHPNFVELLKEAADNQSKHDCLIKPLKDLANDFIPIAPIIKHESFHEEQEWRLICYSGPGKPAEMKFRKGNSFIIPFINLPITDNEGTLPIKKVIVGPTQDPSLSVRSINMLLQSEKIEGVEVGISEVPYR